MRWTIVTLSKVLSAKIKSDIEIAAFKIELAQLVRGVNRLAVTVDQDKRNTFAAKAKVLIELRPFIEKIYSEAINSYHNNEKRSFASLEAEHGIRKHLLLTMESYFSIDNHKGVLYDEFKKSTEKMEEILNKSIDNR